MPKDIPAVKELAISKGDRSATLRARQLGESFEIEMDGQTDDLEDIIASKRSELTEQQLWEQWATIVSELKRTGWTLHEIISSSTEFSLDDNIVISTLRTPSKPSERLLRIHAEIHEAIAGVFREQTLTTTAAINTFVAEGRHKDAMQALEAGANEGALFRLPPEALLDAMLTIDDRALSDKEARRLKLSLISELSRAGRFAGLEQLIVSFEKRFSSSVSESVKHYFLLLRADIAENTGRRELAYTRFKQFLSVGDDRAIYRGHAHEALARLSLSTPQEALGHIESSATAYFEAGDRKRAARVYARLVNFFDATEPDVAIELVGKAIASARSNSPLDTYARAGLLHLRARLRSERLELEEALADAQDAIQLRSSLTGADNEQIATLNLALHLANQLSREDKRAALQQKLDALMPHADADTLLRARMTSVNFSDPAAVHEISANVEKASDEIKIYWSIQLGLSVAQEDLGAALERLDEARVKLEEKRNSRQNGRLLSIVYTAIGQSYLMHDEKARAVQWFQSAVTLNPRDPTARQNLAALLFRLQRWPEAIAFLENQLRVWGEQSIILYFLGRALLEDRQVSRARTTLHRALQLSPNEKQQSHITRWFDQAMKAQPTSDEHVVQIPTRRKSSISREQFDIELISFAHFIASERRMSFWRSEDRSHRFISKPEQYAKVLLHTFLRGSLGDEVAILDELGAGAGRLDLMVEAPGSGRFIVELKMAGESYSLTYATEGLLQLQHYMNNKQCHLGYLVVFDARRRDFGVGIEPIIDDGTNIIRTYFIDLRPTVNA